LCGGDREEAWDLTQDSWVTVVDRLAKGQTETVTVGFLLSVARSLYLDSWRRQRTLQRKLRLVWSGARDTEPAELSAGKVLDHLSVCSAEHRVVLMLVYVDDIPMNEIAQMLGSSVSSTYSLLARARNELRSHLTEDVT
jgi:RNA polymerase sigma factor (sigma-70 family)